MNLKRYIRPIPDYPKPGIVFQDISPLLGNPEAFVEVVKLIADEWEGRADVIVGLDARGFIFGSAVAHELVLPFVMVRKKGKLPWDTVEVSYDLEYGTDTFQMHADAIKPGDRVLIVDDLLATGGSAAAARSLVEKLDGVVVGCAFVIELKDLNGAVKLPGVPIQSLVVYEKEFA